MQRVNAVNSKDLNSGNVFSTDIANLNFGQLKSLQIHENENEYFLLGRGLSHILRHTGRNIQIVSLFALEGC